jgi:hypothetical protein
MLVIATAGVILDWPWWLVYALIAPLAILLVVSGQLVVYRQLNPNSKSLDRRVPVGLVVPIVVFAAIQATRYAALIVVAAFAVVLIFSRRAEGTTANPVNVTR